MGIRFKKISQTDRACGYALIEDISSSDRRQLVNWLETHCPEAYSLSNLHLFIERRSELFFELTFSVG